MAGLVAQESIDTYQNDGVVFIKGLFADWVPALTRGVEQNLDEPGRTESSTMMTPAVVSSATTATGSAFPNTRISSNTRVAPSWPPN